MREFLSQNKKTPPIPPRKKHRCRPSRRGKSKTRPTLTLLPAAATASLQAAAAHPALQAAAAAAHPALQAAAAHLALQAVVG
jgi:hypothetical protein